MFLKENGLEKLEIYLFAKFRSYIGSPVKANENFYLEFPSL